jgi:uncharacterized membrane protein YcaP (DUF421 family)
VILVDDGRILTDRLRRANLQEEDILEQARQLHGLESMEQVKFAVLEKSGSISIVPRARV